MRQAKTIALGAFVVLHATTVFSFSIAPDAERAGMHWLRATVENAGIITLCTKLEAEILELPEDERAVYYEEAGITSPGLARLAKAGQDLQYYFIQV